ncbi:MAG: hypothetical protein RI560_11485 [Natronomonas sp.]|jgi:hypothetical protein|uniref:hypothetical protein n=1 Tax=Natronomonas sp. TaxID=2184060 RepID=UPI00286FB2A3|nr:hypothetical protein [Natronomonas sp.]MDR9382274.1 hypothetical protein [Natronomonas sp.]MDR9429272.1 hypothetical protein [Natronomonas sp.]
MLGRSVRIAFVATGAGFLAVSAFLAVRLGPAAAASGGPVGGAAIAIVVSAGFGLFFLVSGIKGTVE